MIENEEMPLFVQEIWTILVNFLLRAKHESLVISKIFEDIAKCLFDRDLFENSLVCYIISVLSGSKSPNSDVIDKIDYLLTWFCRNPAIDTINFSTIHILNVFVDKIDSLKSSVIMWRSQFIRLIYSQFLHDFGQFNKITMNELALALEFAKKNFNYVNLHFLTEEFSVLEARNMVKFENTQSNSHLISSFHEKNSKTSSPKVSFEPDLNISRPSINSDFGDYVHMSPKYEHTIQADEYAPSANNASVENNFSVESFNNNLHRDTLKSEKIDSPRSSTSEASQTLSSNQEKSDNGGNVFGKIKSWFPAGKLGNSSNQDNQKQITKAKMGKPNSFRYDEKLKKWVDDNDPSTFEQAPKLPPPPTAVTASSSPNQQIPASNNAINFRAKKGKVKYFDPLNPDAPNSSVLQPSVPNFD